MEIKISICGETLQEIKDTYGNDSYDTVSTVLFDILWRYFNNEYFDPDIELEDNDFLGIDESKSMNYTIKI